MAANIEIDLMMGENVAGVILAPTASTGAAYRQLFDAKIPVVLIDRKLPEVATGGLEIDSVTVENVMATLQLISHLIENGHTRIGAVIGKPDVSTGGERQDGYLRALAQYQIPFDTELLRVGVPKSGDGLRANPYVATLARSAHGSLYKQ